MVSLQFILDTMIKFNKSLSKIISDLEESSPILKNSLLEISPVNFCINIKNHQNIYIVIDRDNSKILFEEIEHQFEINGSLFELLKVVITKKIDKNIIKGDVELAMTFFNIIFNSNIDIIYLIDNNGNLKWKKSIEEKIIGKISYLDYYKNNKYQIINNNYYYKNTYIA